MTGATPADAASAESIGTARQNLWLTATVTMALCVGLALRSFQLDLQILVDDEWHALSKISSSSYLEIAGSFGFHDHSIPLTLLYKWIADHGALSEPAMFALPYACGVIACVFAAWAHRQWTTPMALGLFALLLATSPLLVLYTRQARPYAITLMLGLVAIWAIYRWYRQGGNRFAVLYVVAGSTAIYFHLIVAPALLGVWAWFAVDWWFGGARDPKRLAQLATWGTVTTAVVAMLIGPPLAHDWGALTAKVGVDEVTAAAIYRMLMLVIGTRWPWLMITSMVLAAIGTALLMRRYPHATFFAVGLVALQVLFVAASGALWLSHALLLARYTLLCLPLFLYAIAVGFAWVIEQAIAGRSFRNSIAFAATLTFAGLLYLSGPLPAALAYPDSFFSHLIHFFDVDPAHNELVALLKPGPMPEFYRGLAAYEPGTKVVIEAPWRFESLFNRLPYFQQVHRQRVKIGFVGELCPPGAYAEFRRGRFRNFVDLNQPIAALRKSGDYIVFHKRLELANMTESWQRYEGKGLPAVDACIEKFKAIQGPPFFEDATVTVFRLELSEAP